jgi:peptidyl-prolyl cis-trans isomerase C
MFYNNPRKGARMIASKPCRMIFAGALAVCLASAMPALAQTEDSVIAKIGDQSITERDLALATADLAEQFAQVPEESRKAAILNALIDVKLLAAKGEAAGIEKEPSFVARMQFLRERALHNAYFQENALNKVTDEEVKARYDKEVAAMPPQQELHAMHILVKSKEEADKIIKELEAGKDFGELAKANSTDPSAAQNGGDLGFFAKGQMVPEFEAAVFAMKDGEFTKVPVQTQFGFHVIKRVEERNVPAPEFKDVEGQVRQLVVREKYAALIEDARKGVTIEVMDENLKKQIDQAQQPQQPQQ